MFLHLGVDTVIPLKNVITINDLKSTKSRINDEFISKMKNEKKIVDISSNNAKSFIITDKKIYLSAISAMTLKKRAGYIPADEDITD